MLDQDTLAKLSEPFPPSSVSLKVQTKPNSNGNVLVVPYIDARDVIERLNQVVGGDWSDSYRASPMGKGLQCNLTVCGVTRSDVGNTDSDNEAEKSAYSDALKRAAVKFGVGLFLYSLPKQYGKVKAGTQFLADGEEERIRANLFGGKKTSPPKQEGEKKATPKAFDWLSQRSGLVFKAKSLSQYAKVENQPNVIAEVLSKLLEEGKIKTDSKDDEILNVLKAM